MINTKRWELEQTPEQRANEINEPRQRQTIELKLTLELKFTVRVWSLVSEIEWSFVSAKEKVQRMQFNAEKVAQKMRVMTWNNL